MKKVNFRLCLRDFAELSTILLVVEMFSMNLLFETYCSMKFSPFKIDES